MSATNEHGLRQAAAPQPADLGPMPVWDLRGVYQDRDSEAVPTRPGTRPPKARRIEASYQGQQLRRSWPGPPRLPRRSTAYENLCELPRRVRAYAGLLYAADAAMPVHAKFLRRHPQQLAAHRRGPDLLRFRPRRFDDAALEPIAEGFPQRPRYRRPWLDDFAPRSPAAGGAPGAALPRDALTSRQRLEPAVQRDHDGATVRGEGDRRRFALEPALNLLRSPTACRRQAAAERWPRCSGTTSVSSPSSQHARQGQGDLRPLARLRGRGRQPASRRPRRGRGGGRHGRVVRDAYPATAHRYYAMKAGWLGKPRLAYWDRNAPLQTGRGVVLWAEARRPPSLRPRRASSPAHGRHRRALLRPRLDRRAGARASAGASLPDGTLRAPLHPDEPGQAARCDDPGPHLGHGVHQTLAAPLGPALAYASHAGGTTWRSARCSPSRPCSPPPGMPGSARPCWRRRWRA